VSGLGRTDTPTLLADAWRIPAKSDLPSREPFLRRVSLWFVGPAVLSAVWWTVTSAHFEQPEFRAALLAYAIVAPALVGLLWWQRRPESRIGPLLTAFGFAAWPLCLQGSEVPFLFSLGVMAEAPYALLTFFMCIVMPIGRLTSKFEKGILAAWGVVLLIGWTPYVVMLPTLQGGGPLSACMPSCPSNAFAVIDPSSELLTLVGTAGTIATITFAALLLGHQVVRFGLASNAWRRTNWPIVVSIAVFLVAFTGYHLHLGLAPLSPDAMSLMATIYMAASVVLPLGFLVALVRAELFSAAAVRRLALSLGFANDTTQLQHSLSTALGDPGLRLGIWDASGHAFIQPDGTDLPSAHADGTRNICVPIAHDDVPVGAFIADGALATESRLLATAADAAYVAIRGERIAEDTLALRATAVSSTDVERQRIARDMHDSAQQRLVSLRVQVGMASEKLDDRPDEQQVLNRLGHELDYAIEDVRNLARRFLTPFVVRNGLGAAIRAITRPWPMTVRVDDRGLSRHHPTTELAVYNMCLEALQNSLDHGGKGVSASVRIKDSGEGIWFSVVDDGVGFDQRTTQPGHGLSGMTDRAILAGGAISVRAAPAHGVTISGRIPDSRGPV